MNKTLLHSVGLYLIPLITIVSILFYLPVTPNFFTTAKQFALVLSAGILIISWGVSSFQKNELTLTRSPLHVPLALFVLAIASNFFVNKEGWLESVTGRGSLYIAAAVVGYFASLLTTPTVRRWFIYGFIGSVSILAFHSLLQLTVLFQIESLPSYMTTRAFTPTGSPLTTLILLAIGAVTTFYYATRSAKDSLQYFLFVVGTLQTIAVVAYISLMLPGNELSPNLLPYQSSWAVMLDALKSVRSTFFGVGLANFSSLFTAVKPLGLNAGTQWNVFPASASSELLQLLTTAGIIGMASFLFVAVRGITHRGKSTGIHNTLRLIAVMSLVSFVLTPASLPVIVIFFTSLGLLAHTEEKKVNLNPGSRWAALAMSLILGLTVLYYSSRTYAAEIHMLRAQKALAASDGRAVYDEHIKAIRLMPATTSYRLSYAQVNLSLASALSQKTDLTDSEREQVTTLVQQAIREAKLAARLRPNDVRTWQNLGSIYRNLINVADGADQFAISSYAQAVSLDPGNPALRVEFGGLLYQLAGTAKDPNTKNGLLARAVQEFQTAIQLKDDYANAYYNLSKALESAGNSQGAYAAMQQAVAGLDPTSPDLEKATGELEALKAKLPKPSASPSPAPENTSEPEPAAEGDLSQPSPLPSPLSGGPIEIPEEPTPSPTPSE